MNTEQQKAVREAAGMFTLEQMAEYIEYMRMTTHDTEEEN